MTKPKTRERLEKTLARVAREQGLDQERLRRKWRPELESMAQELGFALTAAAEIEQRFLDIIKTLADARRPQSE
jgi:hypothetical protein